jgi:superfamily II RNA helicase
MSTASKVIGNEDLEIKFNEASKCLKRGIIFAASLYL